MILAPLFQDAGKAEFSRLHCSRLLMKIWCWSVLFDVRMFMSLANGNAMFVFAGMMCMSSLVAACDSTDASEGHAGDTFIPGPLAEKSEEPGESPEQSSNAVLFEIAVSTGNRYVFLDDGDGGVIALEIGAPGAPSLKDYGELDGTNPLDVFLAVAPPSDPIPSAFSAYQERAGEFGERGWAVREWEELGLTNRPSPALVTCTDSWFYDEADGVAAAPFDSEYYSYNGGFASGDLIRTIYAGWLNEWWGGVCLQSLSPNTVGNFYLDFWYNTAWAGTALFPCNTGIYPPLGTCMGCTHAWSGFLTQGGYLNWWWQCSTYPNCHSTEGCGWGYDDEFGRRWYIELRRNNYDVSATFDVGARWSMRW
ncbi:hypothetical protein [Nannocystis sp. SCPEA4]|uniref:hypothetical protein n=1 Tax=Nannocystis sp. SCPEA4 TaxID=2996787 RepID=UPI00226F1BFA|nr:hypothetical protein [Nannocystis sp. SCPEA4]MCY1062466.1 hypothetical protein [Nannocystis sp. SCPEA4]